jgi:integrase
MVRRKAIAPQCKSFDKRDDAVRWARELEAEADRLGLIADARLAAKMTLGELLSRYRNQISPNKRSAHTEAARIAAMARRAIAQRVLGRLTSADVATYRDERLKEVAPATVVRELNILSHAIDIAAKEWGIPLPRNPVRLVRKPRVPNGRKRRLHEGEEARLLAACELHRPALIRPLVILAIETAMRRGELLNLRWIDVDFETRVAHLRMTKGGESRDVPLSHRATNTLLALLCAKKNTPEFVFNASANTARVAFERARSSAQLADLRFHDLRHEAVSRLFERGLNIAEVSAISGHKELRMLQRYTHLRAADLALRLDVRN